MKTKIKGLEWKVKQGNTNNESNNLYKFAFKALKVRKTPEKLRALESPVTSFAEASISAKSWYSKRDSMVNGSSVALIVPTAVFSGPFQSVHSDSSNSSICNYAATTPVTPASHTLSPMVSLEKEQEGMLSIKMLDLNVTDDHKTSLNDSFGSCPNSSFNKGALDFLSLVEKAIKKSEDAAAKIGFDALIIDIMDLGVNDKLSTSAEIPDRLNMQGWDASQVSQVWSVGPSSSQGKAWDVTVLKKLGGSSVFSDVWEALKANRQAGHNKRPADSDAIQSSSAAKKLKPSNKGTVVPIATSVAKSRTSEVSSSIETPLKGSNRHSTPAITNASVVEVSPCPSRIKKRARRTVQLATPRITEWLRKCPSNSHIQQPSPSDSPQDHNRKSKRGRKRAMRKKEEVVARQLILDPAHNKPNVAALEDHEASDHSAMSPELRGSHTSWNPATSVHQRTADLDVQDVSEQRCGLTAFE